MGASAPILLLQKNGAGYLIRSNSVGRIQRRMKLRFAVGEQIDFDPALLTFVERRSSDLNLLSTRVSVLHFQRSASSGLNPVMEFSARRNGIRSETRARVVNFQQRDCAPSVVLYRRFDVIRVACAQQDTCSEDQQADTAVNATRSLHSSAPVFSAVEFCDATAASRFSR